MRNPLLAFLMIFTAAFAVVCGEDDSRDVNFFVRDGYETIAVDFGNNGSDDGLSDVYLPDLPFEVVSCTTSEDCPAEYPFCDPLRDGCVECLVQADCEGRGFCVYGVCEPVICQPNSRGCVQNKAQVCSQDGMYLDEFDCGVQYCYEGRCYDCIPNSVNCPAIDVAAKCLPDGSGWVETACQGEMRCVNGDCMACIPGFTICGTGSDDASVVYKCMADGSGYMPSDDCDTENTGAMCHLGLCVNLCEFNEKFKTNLGCEYWAVDMEQFYESGSTYDGGRGSPFAIVVSNTNDSFTATVTVTNPNGTAKDYSAPPNQATIINLEPLNIEGAGVTNKAWHLKSNLPIVAFQFNPLENVEVFSNDASLLLPSSSLGKKYIGMSWPHIGYNGDQQDLSSNLVIVAVEEGETNVTIKSTARLISGGGIPVTSAGGTAQLKMTKGQVANLLAADRYGDLSGSLIDSDKKIAVFGGHVCATAPISRCKSGRCTYDPDNTSCDSDDECSVCCCDHLEEQIQPMGALGQEYVISKSQLRGKAPDMIRVVAAEDGTTITVSPAVATIPALNQGGVYEFETLQNVELTSTKPFLVGQFLESENAPGASHIACLDWLYDLCDGSYGCTCIDVDTGAEYGSCTDTSDCGDDAGIGDPSFIVGVPAEQFRKEYVFLVPVKYRDNYISVVAPVGATVTVDGASLSGWEKLPSGNWQVARRSLNAGSHALTSDEKVGLYVYGWDTYVSYGYPGGMNIDVLRVYQ